MSDRFGVTVRVDPEVDAKLSAVCDALGISRNEYINNLIANDLINYQRMHDKLSAAFASTTTDDRRNSVKQSETHVIPVVGGVK